MQVKDMLGAAAVLAATLTGCGAGGETPATTPAPTSQTPDPGADYTGPGGGMRSTGEPGPTNDCLGAASATGIPTDTSGRAPLSICAQIGWLDIDVPTS